MNSSKSHGEVINIASGNPVTIKSVVENIQNIIRSGSPEFGGILYRPGENMRLYADTIKANNILNWEPKVTLNDGLLRTIQWSKK